MIILDFPFFFFCKVSMCVTIHIFLKSLETLSVLKSQQLIPTLCMIVEWTFEYVCVPNIQLFHMIHHHIQKTLCVSVCHTHPGTFSQRTGTSSITVTPCTWLISLWPLERERHTKKEKWISMPCGFWFKHRGMRIGR